MWRIRVMHGAEEPDVLEAETAWESLVIAKRHLRQGDEVLSISNDSGRIMLDQLELEDLFGEPAAPATARRSLESTSPR
ncbi:MAG TPA: hypothetical protein VM074_03475 [Solimonas sp.]|nr:hypothetical protein [Solimonas sp.]